MVFLAPSEKRARLARKAVAHTNLSLSPLRCPPHLPPLIKNGDIFCAGLGVRSLCFSPNFYGRLCYEGFLPICCEVAFYFPSQPTSKPVTVHTQFKSKRKNESGQLQP